jgi:hypothetical protein
MTIEFVDGVADVVVVGPTVRIDFFVLRPDRRADRRSGEHPELVRMPAQTLVLPMEGFVNAIAVLEKVRNRIGEKVASSLRDIDGHAEEQAESPNFKVRSH